MPLSTSIIDRTLATTYGERAYKIVEQLTDAGYDTWWVGGCVRDMLDGKIPKDIDICTAATPSEIAIYFPKATELTRRSSESEAGQKHSLGSVRIPMSTDTFEVTTFREDDDKSDGRHPESIKYSTREKDAIRRDFTVNALYFNPISKELYDPCDGADDLKERLITFIGDPTTRIKQDALRLLRAVRFRALLNGQYHPDTYAALRTLAPLVETLSGTRQLEETEKILLGPHPDIAFEDLREIGILERFVPELSKCRGIPQPVQYHTEGDVWEHMLCVMRALRDEDKIDVRIAALFHDCGKAETFSLKERIRFDHHASVSADLAKQALTRLAMPKKRIDKIVWLITHHMMMGSFTADPDNTNSPMSDDRKAYWYHHEWFSELIQLFYLDAAGTVPAGFDLYDSIVQDRARFLDAHPRPGKPLLTGDEIMKLLGIKSGEQVGVVIEQLHKAQINKEVSSKEEAKQFIQKLQR